MAKGKDFEDHVFKRGYVRWIPFLVVTTAVVGFFSLAWYAYHTGTQSSRDEDMLVVEADSTPMKEKPEDPGGMKFPNQDKTVFETLSANGATPPKVERVLPAPEEPLPRNMDMSESTTWVNDEVKGEGSKVEPIAVEPSAPAQVAVHEAPPASLLKDSDIRTYKAEPKEEPKPEVKEEAPSTPVMLEAKKEEKPKSVEKPKPAEKEKPAPKASGTALIQLGAYQSEIEAKAGWEKLKKKFSVLSGEPIIVKADLGAKGIYYRLRTKVADAKATCASLSAKGQACLVP